jgi:hypothetical protein
VGERDLASNHRIVAGYVRGRLVPTMLQLDVEPHAELLYSELTPVKPYRSGGC